MDSPSLRRRRIELILDMLIIAFPALLDR
jgi:hypothetical protein